MAIAERCSSSTRKTRVEEKHVKLGQSDGTWLEIISGVNEGERVIVGHLGEYRTGRRCSRRN